MKAQFVLGELILTSILFPGLPGLAQVNSWTSPSSGNWHDSSWSLGVLPNSSQSDIMITNSGWKAVAINRTSALNYPDSLNIRRLTVSSPVDSFNTFMLNFSGREWPLRVAESFYLGTNSVFRILDSGLHVGNLFTIDGTVIHTDFSEVSAPLLYVGNNVERGADYNLTNGTLTVSNRLFVGANSYGIVRQYGGSNRVAEFRLGYGNYQLHGGNLTANALKMGSQFSLFDQYDGSVSITNTLVIGENDGSFNPPFNITGRYTLSNGTLRVPSIRVGTHKDSSEYGGGEGAFVQYGGSNVTDSLYLGARGTANTFHINYTLGGGTLLSSATTLAEGHDVSFSHSGGLHIVNGRLNVRGLWDPLSTDNRGPQYGLWPGATLKSHSLDVAQGLFFQVGGSNEVAGDLLVAAGAHIPTEYILRSGVITSSNTVVRGGYYGERFRHEDGDHVVRGVLDMLGFYAESNIYDFSGGRLVAPHISLYHCAFNHLGNGVVSNSSSVTMSGGRWAEYNDGTINLGTLRLESGVVGYDSIITLYGNVITFRFLSSAAIPWSPDGRLLIPSWRGSTSGGGNHQIIFGTSAIGLTAQQLSQIRFRNPAGFPPGDYPARILATGEIVPTPQLPVMFTRDGSRMVLEWPAGYTLQSATNVSGPFTDINTASPYEIQTGTEGQRYFRLRRTP